VYIFFSPVGLVALAVAAFLAAAALTGAFLFAEWCSVAIGAETSDEFGWESE
jgi:hypothetical protein